MLRTSELIDYFYRNKPRKLSSRDRVAMEGGTAKYILWGSEIASKKGRTLVVSDCGYRRKLTRKRLNQLIIRWKMFIYSRYGKWRININGREDIYWEGTHVIRTDTGEISPARKCKSCPSVADRIARLERALRTMNRTYAYGTLQGTDVFLIEAPLFNRSEFRQGCLKISVEGNHVSTSVCSIPVASLAASILRGKSLRTSVEYELGIPQFLERMKTEGISTDSVPEEVMDKVFAEVLVGDHKQ